MDRKIEVGELCAEQILQISGGFYFAAFAHWISTRANNSSVVTQNAAGTGNSIVVSK